MATAVRPRRARLRLASRPKPAAQVSVTRRPWCSDGAIATAIGSETPCDWWMMWCCNLVPCTARGAAHGTTTRRPHAGQVNWSTVSRHLGHVRVGVGLGSFYRCARRGRAPTGRVCHRAGDNPRTPEVPRQGRAFPGCRTSKVYSTYWYNNFQRRSFFHVCRRCDVNRPHLEWCKSHN